MPKKKDSKIDKDALKVVYQETCSWYHRIDDFRAKLLGFLPFISGAGIFIILKSDIAKEVGENFLAFFGLLGFMITLGLLFYELRGLQRCIRLRNVGKDLEEMMEVNGPFKLWPKSFKGFVNEPIAASMIYPSILAAWIYIAMKYFKTEYPHWIASSVFIISFIGVLLFFRFYRKDPEYFQDKEKIKIHKS